MSGGGNFRSDASTYESKEPVPILTKQNTRSAPAPIHMTPGQFELTDVDRRSSTSNANKNWTLEVTSLNQRPAESVNENRRPSTSTDHGPRRSSVSLSQQRRRPSTSHASENNLRPSTSIHEDQRRPSGEMKRRPTIERVAALSHSLRFPQASTSLFRPNTVRVAGCGVSKFLDKSERGSSTEVGKKSDGDTISDRKVVYGSIGSTTEITGRKFVSKHGHHHRRRLQSGKPTASPASMRSQGHGEGKSSLAVASSNASRARAVAWTQWDRPGDRGELDPESDHVYVGGDVAGAGGNNGAAAGAWWGGDDQVRLAIATQVFGQCRNGCITSSFIVWRH